MAGVVRKTRGKNRQKLRELLADPVMRRNEPDLILAEMRKQGKMLLEDLFQGPLYEPARQAILDKGEWTQGRRTVRVQTRKIEGTDAHEVMAIAAVSRDPGRSDDIIPTIADFQISTKPQSVKVLYYWNVYQNEGIVNNAVNKIAAILSTGGRFRVKNAKKGKKRNATDELLQVLDWWTRNVNAAPVDAVVTGARGLKAVTHQGVRQALVEGSWIGRQVWVPAEVPSIGTFDLPMNIQSLSTQYIQPVEGISAIGDAELYYWQPPGTLINQIKSPSTPEVRKMIQKYLPSDIRSKLVKDGKVMLDPALMTHIRNRGRGQDQFGESFIQSAMFAIAYRKAVEQLDLVSMQNLINRLTIVMVGSDDPKSPYGDAAVAKARAALMQSFFDDPGPNMTIIWSGNDVKVEDVGAHTSVLTLDERHKIAETKIKMSLGVPDALLAGTTMDGKAAGWAAAIGAAAELEELQNNFAQAFTTIGEQIAMENGYTDVDIIFEFSHSLIVDRMAERDQLRNDYQAGIISIMTYLEGIGRDPQAEFQQKCEEKGLDPDVATWEQAFAPPQGLPGQAPAVAPGDPNAAPADPNAAPAPPPGAGPGKVPGSGRTPNRQTGKTGPDRKVVPTTQENK